MRACRRGRSMRSQRVHWRCHGIAAVMFTFPRRAGRRSGLLFGTPWERRPGVTAV